MTDLRRLSIDEIDKTFEGGRRFLEEAKFPAPFSPEAFKEFWEFLMQHDLGEIWAAFDGDTVLGAIGFCMHKCPFTGVKGALETFWFVHPEYRGGAVGMQLLGKFEDRAQIKGAKRLAMVHLASLNLQKVFESRGYVLADQTFWKEI